MVDLLVKLLGPTLYNLGVSEADLISYLTQLEGYIYAIIAAVVVLVAVMFLAHFAKKGFRCAVRLEAFMAFLTAILIIVNSICYGPMYANVSGFLNASKAEFSEETIQQSKDTIEKVGEEGMVLVKNDGLLPLSSDVTNLNVFGWDSTCPIYGGTGSAGSHSDGNVSILQSLQDAGYKTNETLSNMYTEYCAERPAISMSAQDWSLPEPNMKHYTDDIMNEAKDFSDTAMVVLGRPGGEGADLPTNMSAVINGTYNQGLATSNAPANWRYMNATYTNNGSYDDFEEGESYLEPSVTEEQLIEKVCSEFDNVIVVINANNTMELDWVDNYEQINKEDEAEQRKEAEERINKEAENIDINVPVPEYNNLYDTRNLQEELAAKMSDLFGDDEEDDDVKTFVPASKNKEEQPAEKINNPAPVVEQVVNDDTEAQEDDDQIEGQMDITEWMQSVREEKYGKQDTKEFSKSELERYLDEKDEKSAAYEKLVEQKKAEVLADGKEIDKEEAKRAALAQMAVDSARMDLAIRTGKAAARLEQAATAIENEDIPLVTAQIPTVSESMISDINSIMNEDIDNKDNKEEGEEAVVLDEVAAGVEPEETVIPFTRQEEEQPLTMEEEIEETEQIEKKLTGELAKIFRKYRDMPGLEEQLADLFDTIDDEMQMNSSASGNILISGNSSSDKTDLARTIIRAINTLYPDQPKKIAKTSGESINQRGIAKAMGRLKGTALIVEGAGTIQPKRINELLNCLEQDTGRMIVIFEDSDTDMNVLINFNPELTKTFNHRIVLKQYTVNELVEMAKRFARKRQYEVDDDALLELYLKIDKLHNVNDNIKLQGNYQSGNCQF